MSSSYSNFQSKIVEQQCNVGELIPGECYSFRVAVQVERFIFSIN